MATKCPKCDFENPVDTFYCGKCASPLPSSKDIAFSVTKTLQVPIEGLVPGSTFAGRYQIIKELGQGGMGKVYRAMDMEVKEEVALKLIKSEIARDESAIERFRNELKVARKVSHRNVCRMHDLGTAEEGYYITMEYVEGEDLKSHLGRAGKLAESDVIALAKQVCEGLKEAHELGVIHRDMKPQNIMVDKTGRAKIMDFGIARLTEAPGFTATGVMIGTPDYISPEQAEGQEADQRSDIYSLGVILYEMVTGSVPFRGDTALSVALKHKAQLPSDPKKLNPEVSVNLSRLILVCMEKDRERRYQSADALLDDLRNIEQGLPLGTKVRPRRETFIASLVRKKLFTPALVVFLAIIAVLIWRLLPRIGELPISSKKPSIAVLPFDDLSELKDQEYKCEGLAVTLIMALNHIENLYVPAKTSTFSFKGREKNYQEIGEKLNVEFVLEGSVQKYGDELRIAAQIINVSDGSILWGHIYNGEEKEIFDIQDQIAQEVVDNLEIELRGGEKAGLVKRYTENIEAYNTYLKGRWFWDKRKEEDLEKAVNFFKEAIMKDTNYALAYAGLADCYIALSDYGSMPIQEAWVKGKNAALTALEIDDTLAEAHTSLGMIKTYYDWDWEGAEREFRRAIELNQNYATAHHWYALYLMMMLRFDEAIEEIRQALKFDPLSLAINRNIGLVFYTASKYDKAIEASQRTLEMGPDYVYTRLILGLSYSQKSMYMEALEELEREKYKGQFYFAFAGFAYAEMGKINKAQKLLEELLETSEGQLIRPSVFACLYFVIGEKDQSFKWIEKAYKDHDNYLLYIRIFPASRNLAFDPLFKELLKKMGLA